ncbi:MAG: HEPN domain-containing protein [Candidatus Bipolaricaulota bacterium]|nr:HEPN domain-containing protein [Candidatus Bipolaricaulota bacterium]
MRSGDEGARWLAQAQEDLKWAKVLLEQGGYHLVAFLAQQVAEKALKGVLYHCGEEAVLGHSVDRLASEVQTRFPEIAPHVSRWATLDLHYVASRYPNSVPGSIPARVYSRDTAEAALRMAEEVVRFAEKTLYRDR